MRGDRAPSERLDVLDCGDEAGEQLVGERAGLEAVTERLSAPAPSIVAAATTSPDPSVT